MRLHTEFFFFFFFFLFGRMSVSSVFGPVPEKKESKMEKVVELFSLIGEDKRIIVCILWNKVEDIAFHSHIY